MNLEWIADYNCKTGEGPLWHADEKRLYWVDIPNGRLFRYDPGANRHEMCLEGRPIGGFTIQADGALLLFMDKGAVAVWRNGNIEKYIIDEIPAERQTRFNDVIADPAGRVFCGTMPTKQRPGRLYRLDPDGTLTEVVSDVGVSNGLGFTPDRRGLYYTDSTEHVIYLFDYDEATGALNNRRDFVRVPQVGNEGVPDGMTVDAEGHVWSARWDGGCLVRYTPAGEEVQRITLPARKVSCVTFGGEDYTDMYVTTANIEGKKREGAGAGVLFRLNLGIRGLPEFRSRIGL
ncbi:MAG: SMP-30/gluconolactonase/LRE family protein [Anaerolineae bacterium]|nr:SMP-30/gluconolactonase/LRE family protein [Anaerolineae bacterium]